MIHHNILLLLLVDPSLLLTTSQDLLLHKIKKRAETLLGLSCVSQCFLKMPLSGGYNNAKKLNEKNLRKECSSNEIRRTSIIVS